MHEHGVGAPFERAFEQGRRGGHAGGDPLDAAAPFYLQAVRAVVLEPRNVQGIVQVQFEFDPVHIFPLISSNA
jgi:hypothetical protein